MNMYDSIQTRKKFNVTARGRKYWNGKGSEEMEKSPVEVNGWRRMHWNGGGEKKKEN